MRGRQQKYIDFRIDVSQCLIGREEINLLTYSERCTGVLVMIFISTNYILRIQNGEEDYYDGDFITIIPSTVGKGDRYEQLYILKAA